MLPPPAAAAAADATIAAPSAVVVSRMVAGTGDRSGTLLLRVQSTARTPLRVRCVDILPDWMPLYWHTLRAWDANGTAMGSPMDALAPVAFVPADVEAPRSWLRLLAGGSLQRGAGDVAGVRLGMDSGASSATATAHVLGWSATLAPRGSLLVGIDFAKPLRHVDRMPANPSRGLDVGPAAIAVARVSGDTEPAEDDAWTVVYTEAALVPVPIADASMPFNVVAISSTLIALFVGSMFNLMTRPTRLES